MPMLPNSLPNLQLNPSKYLTGVLILTQLGAIIVLLFLPLPWVWILLGSGLCLGSFIVNLQRHVLKSSTRAIIGLRALNKQQWLLEDRQGNSIEANLIASYSGRFISSWLVILNFKLQAKRWPQAVLIARDALSSDQFRQLVAYLRSM